MQSRQWKFKLEEIHEVLCIYLFYIYLCQVSMTLLNWTIYVNAICEQYYSFPVVYSCPRKSNDRFDLL